MSQAVRGVGLLIPIVLLPLLGGCGSILGLVGEKVPVYAGVQYDVNLIVDGVIPARGGTELGPAFRIIAGFDLPLSLGVDTGLLPITLIVWLIKVVSRPPPPE